MAASASPGARRLAFLVLQELERRDLLADEVLHEALARSGLDIRDRGLAVELTYGVLRHRLTLDWRLDHVASRPMARLPLPVQTALRLGAYQLLYLDRIPPSAAVNESVALVKQRTGRDWTGFVNAVLRAVIRSPAPTWPDIGADPIAALSLRYAVPRWLAARWVAAHGAENAETLCRKSSEVPPLTIRTNTLRWTRNALETRLRDAGIITRSTEVSPVGLVLDKQGDVRALPLFADGGFYIEDEAAQLIPPLLDPQPGERVLDACAAPGGKATHLAALMQNRGEIVAVDASSRRLARLEENALRLGVTILNALVMDVVRLGAESKGQLPASLGTPFDRLLVDAPCSGLGVLRRHPEAKWRKDESTLAAQQARQVEILAGVHDLLRPGGVIVYSTCSTEPEENEQVIERFCSAHPEYAVEFVASRLPPSAADLITARGSLSTMFASQPMDGFFAARLRKAG